MMVLATFLTLLTHAATETWVIDAAHSKVGFEVTHLVISTVEGKFSKFDGELQFDADNPKAVKSFKATINVDPASIDTANSKRDQHLRSPDFFDVKKHKKMVFTSKSVKSADGKSFKIMGTLDMAGVKKDVTLDAKYLGSVSAYDVRRVAFTAQTKVKRQDFNLKWNDVVEAGPVVGSDVTIHLKVQAKRKADL